MAAPHPRASATLQDFPAGGTCSGHELPYLDAAALTAQARQGDAFRHKAPYPWMSMQGLIHEDQFRRLCATPPDFGLFAPEFRKKRAGGQQSHDRYVLQYAPALDPQLPPAWVAFIHELHSRRYKSFLRAVYGLSASEPMLLTMHWHFAPAGASVSPHVDASRKIGSHIFYFNSEEDWRPEWGGETLVLDDENQLSPRSSPGFDALKQVGASEILGNRSFIFMRTDHSWHAVRPVQCPKGAFRKVFIVVANRLNFQVLSRRIRGKDPDGYPL